MIAEMLASLLGSKKRKPQADGLISVTLTVKADGVAYTTTITGLTEEQLPGALELLKGEVQPKADTEDVQRTGGLEGADRIPWQQWMQASTNDFKEPVTQ